MMRDEAAHRKLDILTLAVQYLIHNLVLKDPAMAKIDDLETEMTDLEAFVDRALSHSTEHDERLAKLQDRVNAMKTKLHDVASVMQGAESQEVQHDPADYASAV